MFESNLSEARRDFLRAADLESTNDAMRAEARARIGDIDFLIISANPALRDALTEMKEMSDKLKQKDPNSYDGFRLAGYYEMLHDKDLKAALADFQKANQTKPYQPEVITMLVQLLMSQNEAPEAEKLAKELIQRNKTYDKIYDVMYSYYIRSKRVDDAEALLKQKIANNPTRGNFLTQLAFHYYLTRRKADMLATLSRLTSDSKAFPNGHLLAGDYYYTIRDFDAAIDQYRQGEKDDSKQKPLYQKKLVEALTMRGKTDEASKVVAELLKQNPNDPEAIAMHAAIMLQGVNPKQADAIIAELQPLVVKTPTNQVERLALLHFNLARAYALKGDQQSLDQARLHFQETIKLKPTYIPAKLALAQLEINRGENPLAVQHAQEILKLDPANVTARLVQTLALMNMKDYEQCRKQLTAIVMTYPTSNDARFQMGRLDYVQGRFKDAEADYGMLVKANDPRGVTGLVECKVAQGQYKEAVDLVSSMIAKNPDYAPYRIALSSLEFNSKNYAESAKQLQAVIDKYPNSPQLGNYYMRLGEAKRMQGDINGAVSAFHKTADLTPKDPTPYLQLALLYENSGQPEEARKAYETVLKMQPDDPVALNNIAYAKADEGIDLDQAMTYAERAQNKRPNDPNVMDTVALIFIQKNLIDDGLRLERELVGRVPQNATFHLHLAMALYKKGVKDEAKKELQTAMRNNPTDREQQKIRDLMAKIG